MEPEHAFGVEDIHMILDIVIVGASLSGIRCAEALRARGFGGSVTIVGDESEQPYDRPPLSKQYLAGSSDDARLLLCAPDRQRDLALGVHTGIRATRLIRGDDSQTDERATHHLEFDNGHTLRADAVVLATGTRLRPAPFPVTHPNAFGLRTKADAIRLRPLLQPGSRVVVIGAGFIGAEVASTAHEAGCKVTVVEAASVPLQRPLGAQMGEAVGGLHAANDVELVCSSTVLAVEPGSVVLADRSIDADVVVIGIGVQPNTEWLEDSGLLIDNGVVTNECLYAQTPNGVINPSIVAIGDLARFPHDMYGESMRLEHWTNAVESASHAAGTVLGDATPYRPVPYFWSDQYGKKIQFLGRATLADEVRIVDGDPSEGSWLALYRRDDQFVGALGVSKIRSLMKLRPLLTQHTPWDDAVAVATGQ